ncbi:S9 family peptidase [Cellulomonas sp. Leaf334]|uniref:alpha/beta hydrolase family protein n=1 Tax=Cellulomonas sp. Leaf334 TaxID=1736339 RepID=UPI0006F98860|nr:alpha/beta hydrolase [Cellulomonas sp. Leaf334]KQR10979.1 hypothetical protein ASF78_14970 [Cellulomonas sp. Leaf334]
MGTPDTIVFADEFYDGALARTLAASYAEMADLGEALATARAVGRPTPQGWYTAWSARADRVNALGERAETAGNHLTARAAFLRASEYYRQALFFIRRDPEDPRLLGALERHVASFARALPMLDCHAEAIAIPYEGTTLKGFFFAPDDAGTARPTMVFPAGYDSTAENGYVNVPAALARGYNAVVFEGPGQGEALYRQHLPFRPDFDAVLSPLIDLLLTRADVSADKVVLIGRSFAGYLAPQAATVEHRLAALVCDPAQPAMSMKIPAGVVGRIAVPVIRLQMRRSVDRAEFFGARMAGHGLTDVRAYLRELGRFDMLADAGRITCPTLLVECEGDFAGGAGPVLQAALRCRNTLIRLGAAQGAGGHVGGLGQRVWEGAVYDWIAAELHV